MTDAAADREIDVVMRLIRTVLSRSFWKDDGGEYAMMFGERIKFNEHNMSLSIADQTYNLQLVKEEPNVAVAQIRIALAKFVFEHKSAEHAFVYWEKRFESAVVCHSNEAGGCYLSAGGMIIELVRAHETAVLDYEDMVKRIDKQNCYSDYSLVHHMTDYINGLDFTKFSSAQHIKFDEHDKTRVNILDVPYFFRVRRVSQ